MNLKDIPFVRNTGGAMCSPAGLDCQTHEPLQLAKHPDEINLFTALDF